MFWSILHRTILWELTRVFALSLLGITAILVMAGVVAEATQQGLGPAQIMVAIPLLIPSTLPYTIPATTLFATCVVYGRLAHDNEILAIRAAGINILRVIWPAVFLGLVMTASTMAMYYSVIPTTHHRLRSQILNDVEEYLYALLKKDKCIKQPGMGYVMWVRHVQGTRLQDALFKRYDKKGNYDVIALAREAELRVDLVQRVVLVHMRHCEVKDESNSGSCYFENKIWPVDLPPDFFVQRKLRPRAMTWPELFSRQAEVVQEEAELEDKIAEAEMEAAGPRPRSDIAQHQRNLHNKKKYQKLEMHSLRAEVQMRPALAAGCLCFVLVGCPVGIWFSRSDYLSAFITCFLPITFIYYPLLLCTTNIAKQGDAPPGPAIWVANVLMIVVAGFLFRRLLKN